MSPLPRPRERRRGLPRRGRSIAAAIGVIVVVGALTWYAFGGLRFTSHFTLSAISSNSVNVRDGSPVRIAGVNVGSVLSVEPDGRDSKITFSVDSAALPIHTDATVTIRDRLFLEGNYYLQIDPGSPSAPDLHAGATLGLGQTTSPVQFFQVLDLLNANARFSLSTSVGTLADALGPAGSVDAVGSAGSAGSSGSAPSGAAGVRAAVPVLSPLAEDVAWISQAAQGTAPGQLGSALRSSAAVAEAVARHAADLTGIVEDVDALSTTLDQRDEALAASVSGLDQLARSAPGSLTDIDSTLGPVRSLAVAVTPALAPAPAVLTSLGTTLQRLNRVVGPAERGPLVGSLKAIFTRFPTTLTQLERLFPDTESLSRCLSTHITPILSEVVPDGSLSSGRPAWQDFVHFMVNSASAAQNFDGNGYWYRLLTGLSSNALSLGSLAGTGTLVADSPSADPIQGVRPLWHGDLTDAAFQPGVDCSSDPLPSLATATGSAEPSRTVATTSADAARVDSGQLTLGGLRQIVAHAASLISQRQAAAAAQGTGAAR